MRLKLTQSKRLFLAVTFCAGVVLGYAVRPRIEPSEPMTSQQSNATVSYLKASFAILVAFKVSGLLMTGWMWKKGFFKSPDNFTKEVLKIIERVAEKYYRIYYGIK